MELNEGFKQTEVGVVPEDWELTTLSKVCCAPMQNGVFFNPVNRGSGIGLINVGDLYQRTPIDINLLERFAATDDEINRFKVENGDLFFTRSSIVPNGIAHCNIYIEVNSDPVVFDSHVIRVRSDSKKINPHYLYRFCVSKIARKYLISHAKTATMTTIDQTALGKCPILLPTKVEQTAIAKALSDADAWIQSLSQLIAKKCQIKQGAMQTLLNPYENGKLKNGWSSVRLGDIATFSNGKAHEQFINDIGDYIVVNSKFISTQGNVFKKSNVCFSPLNKGDITMVMSDIPNGKALAKCFVIPENNKYTLNQRICSIHSNTIDNKFLSLILDRNEYFLSFDSGTGQTNLRKEDVLECPLTIPESKREQIAIANILIEMEKELTILEFKLNKTKQIKQGMMQNLLTGRIRLI